MTEVVIVGLKPQSLPAESVRWYETRRDESGGAALGAIFRVTNIQIVYGCILCFYMKL